MKSPMIRGVGNLSENQSGNKEQGIVLFVFRLVLSASFFFLLCRPSSCKGFALVALPSTNLGLGIYAEA